MNTKERWGVLLSAALLVSAACGPAAAFRCEQDRACMAAGIQGSCEPNGYCSFPDEACMSGRRYGERAPEPVAGRCVGDDDAAGSTGAHASTSSVEDASSSASTDPTATSESVGDSTTGDAGSDSTASEFEPLGTPSGQRIRVSNDGNVRAVAPHPGGGLVTVGTTALDGQGNRDAVITHFDGEGSARWAFATATDLNDQYFAVAVNNDRIYGLGLTRSVQLAEITSDQILLSEFALDGTLLRSVIYASQGSELGWAIAPAGNGFVIAGSTDDAGFGAADGLVAALDDQLMLQWSIALGGRGLDRVRAIAPDEEGGFVVAGSFAEAPGVARISADGELDWSFVLERPGELRDIVPVDSGWVAVGELADPARKQPPSGVVMSLSGDGSLSSAVATDADGSTTIGGITFLDDARAWIIGTRESDPWIAQVRNLPNLALGTTIGYPIAGVQPTNSRAIAALANGGIGLGLTTVSEGNGYITALYTDSEGGVGDVCGSVTVGGIGFATLDASWNPIELQSISVALDSITLDPDTLSVDAFRPNTDDDVCF